MNCLSQWHARFWFLICKLNSYSMKERFIIHYCLWSIFCFHWLISYKKLVFSKISRLEKPGCWTRKLFGLNLLGCQTIFLRVSTRCWWQGVTERGSQTTLHIYQLLRILNISNPVVVSGTFWHIPCKIVVGQFKDIFIYIFILFLLCLMPF